MGWWITLGAAFLLAILPLGVRVCYDADGPLVKVVLGPVKITVFPRPKKQKKPRQKQEKKPETQEKPEEANLPKPPQPPAAQKKAQKQKSGGSLKDFLPFVKLGLDFLGDFRRKLRMKDLYLRLILASDDPCDLAINYGKTWTAVGNLRPALERWFVIKRRDVEVECDFTASKTLVTARMDLTITLGRILAAVCKFALHALKEYLNIMKKRKGGAST